MTKIYLGSIPVLFLLDFLTRYFHIGDIPFYGLFVLVVVLAIVGLMIEHIESVMAVVSLVVFTQFLIDFSINEIFDVVVMTDEGQIVPIEIQIVAQMITLGISLAIVGGVALVKHLIDNSRDNRQRTAHQEVKQGRQVSFSANRKR